MACNCSTVEEINRLYEMYGEKSKIPSNTKLSIRIKNFFKKILLIILGVIVSPLIIMYVLFIIFWYKNPKINVQNFNILRQLKIVV